jgi:hypothetical protein
LRSPTREREFTLARSGFPFPLPFRNERVQMGDADAGKRSLPLAPLREVPLAPWTSEFAGFEAGSKSDVMLLSRTGACPRKTISHCPLNSIWHFTGFSQISSLGVLLVFPHFERPHVRSWPSSQVDPVMTEREKNVHCQTINRASVGLGRTSSESWPPRWRDARRRSSKTKTFLGHRAQKSASSLPIRKGSLSPIQTPKMTEC